MNCPVCRKHQLVVIEIGVGAEPVTLVSCSNCESRWWQGSDGSLSLDSVLGMAADSLSAAS